MTNEDYIVHRRAMEATRALLRGTGKSEYEIDKMFARARAERYRIRHKYEKEAAERERTRQARSVELDINLEMISASHQMHITEALENASPEYRRGFQDALQLESEYLIAVHDA